MVLHKIIEEYVKTGTMGTNGLTSDCIVVDIIGSSFVGINVYIYMDAFLITGDCLRKDLITQS